MAIQKDSRDVTIQYVTGFFVNYFVEDNVLKIISSTFSTIFKIYTQANYINYLKTSTISLKSSMIWLFLHIKST